MGFSSREISPKENKCAIRVIFSKILLQRIRHNPISCAHPNRKSKARMAELVDALD
jgi:hypothetical protein